MSAAEVIEQINNLPPSDRRVVEDYVRNGLSGEAQVIYSSNEKFKPAAQEIFEEYDELFRKLAQ